MNVLTVLHTEITHLDPNAEVEPGDISNRTRLFDRIAKQIVKRIGQGDKVYY